MTVAELIEKLKEFDPTDEVRYDDYEYGHDEVRSVEDHYGCYILLSCM